jgi:hypothetical protein
MVEAGKSGSGAATPEMGKRKKRSRNRQTPVIQWARESQTLVPPPKIARGTKATKARVPQM